MIRASAPASDRIVTSMMSCPSNCPKTRVCAMSNPLRPSVPRQGAGDGILPARIFGLAAGAVERRRKAPLERPALGEVGEAGIDAGLEAREIGGADRRGLQDLRAV